MIKKLVFIFLTIFYVFWLFLLFKPFLAEIHAKRAKDILSGGNIVWALDLINSALGLNPHEPSYYRQRAQILLAATATTEAFRNQRPELKYLAYADLKTAEKLNPKNYATLRDNLPFYYYLSVEDLTKIATPQNINPEYLKSTIDQFEWLKTQYPNDVGLMVDIAKYEKKLSLTRGQDGLNFTRNRIENLRTDLLQWHPELR